METDEVTRIRHATANLKNLITDLVNDIDERSKKATTATRTGDQSATADQMVVELTNEANTRLSNFRLQMAGHQPQEEVKDPAQECIDPLNPIFVKMNSLVLEY